MSAGDYDFNDADDVQLLLDRISMRPGLEPKVRLEVHRDKALANGRLFVQAVAPGRLDVVTGKTGDGKGRKAYLSPHMALSEFVQMCLGLIDAYYHHEVREHFLFDGRAVYGPHIDVMSLWKVANDVSYRRTNNGLKLLPNQVTDDQAFPPTVGD